MLRETFIQFISEYKKNKGEVYWEEIAEHYSANTRHYHNLLHLADLLKHLSTIKSSVKNWHAVLFCLYYHDIVYDPLKSDNEEQSAGIAKQRMEGLGVRENTAIEAYRHILATKKHEPSASEDCNYFTDADLAVLGSDWETYAAYSSNIRKEYAVFPDAVYIPGRKKVIEQFLSRKAIYKTGYFSSRFEAQARKNLQKEFKLLL